MVTEEKCIVVDIDGTLCPVKRADEEYDALLPYECMMAKLREYKEAGYYIILYTSRNMRTYGGNMGLIMANTAKSTMQWLDRHGIPYDEIHFGKPWASRVGFYVDDRAVRPDEFLDLSREQIETLLASKTPASSKTRTAAGE
jgi:capsule biosynthesis phosphatase